MNFDPTQASSDLISQENSKNGNEHEPFFGSDQKDFSQNISHISHQKTGDDTTFLQEILKDLSENLESQPQPLGKQDEIPLNIPQKIDSFVEQQKGRQEMASNQKMNEQVIQNNSFFSDFKLPPGIEIKQTTKNEVKQISEELKEEKDENNDIQQEEVINQKKQAERKQLNNSSELIDSSSSSDEIKIVNEIILAGSHVQKVDCETHFKEENSSNSIAFAIKESGNNQSFMKGFNVEQIQYVTHFKGKEEPKSDSNNQIKESAIQSFEEKLMEGSNMKNIEFVTNFNIGSISTNLSNSSNLNSNSQEKIQNSLKQESQEQEQQKVEVEENSEDLFALGGELDLLLSQPSQQKEQIEELVSQISQKPKKQKVKKNNLLSEALSNKICFQEAMSLRNEQKIQFCAVNPRDYQEEIFDNAKDGNYIIYLETGTGKTLVSLMIAYYTLQKHPQSKVVFLANQVNLVEQQYSAFETQIRGVEAYFKQKNEFNIITEARNIRLSHFHGKQNLDYWNRNFWKSQIASLDIIFFTSQVFLNGLRRGYFTLDQFKRVILDECHNAANDHAFAQIMKEFYFQIKQKDVIQPLPFILGLSATPKIQTNNPLTSGNAAEGMLRLAINLDCAFAKYDTNKVSKFLQDTQESVIEYECELEQNVYRYIEMNNITGIQDKEKNQLIRSIYQKCPPIQQLHRQLNALNNKYRQQQISNECYKILKGTESLLSEYLTIIVCQIGECIIHKFISDILKEINKNEFKNSKDLMFINDLIALLQQQVLIFSGLQGQQYQSNKVTKLLHVISEQQNPMNDLQLVFCNSKLIVKYLTVFIQQELSRQDPSSEIIYSDFIMGQGTFNARMEQNKNEEKEETLFRIDRNTIKSLEQEALNKAQENKEYNQVSGQFFDIRQTFRDQLATIKNFKKNHFKILVSTSVAEEGFDIPNCNSVLAFSLITSQRQFVQMKGRARAQSSKFYTLTPSYLKGPNQFQEETTQMRKIFNTICQLSKEQLDLIAQQVPIDIGNVDFEKFEIENTQACVNIYWSKDIVTQFCQASTKGTTFPQIQTYNIASKKQFLSLLVLPFNIKGNLHSNVNKLSNQKQDAERIACLNAVKFLYQNNYLTSDLRPRLQPKKGYYYGTGEDDYGVDFSDKYEKIRKKYIKEMFIWQQDNTKEHSRRVYKKLYKVLLSDVFLQFKSKSLKSVIDDKTQNNNEGNSNNNVFNIFQVSHKGKQLDTVILYPYKQLLNNYAHKSNSNINQDGNVDDLHFTFLDKMHKIIFLNEHQLIPDEKLQMIRKLNEKLNLSSVDLSDSLGQYNTVFDNFQMIFTHTKDFRKEDSKETFSVKDNVIFLFWNMQLDALKQEEMLQKESHVLKDISIISQYYESIRDYIKLQQISIKLQQSFEKNILLYNDNTSTNNSYEELVLTISPHPSLTASYVPPKVLRLVKPSVRSPLNTYISLTQNSIQFLLSQELNKKNSLFPTMAFKGRSLFQFIASLSVFAKNSESSIEVLNSELEVMLTDSFAMSKAVEMKLFRYIPLATNSSILKFNDQFKSSQDQETPDQQQQQIDIAQYDEQKYVIAPCIQIISSKVHKSFAEARNVIEQTQSSCFYKFVENYSLVEFRNKRLANIMFAIVGYASDINSSLDYQQQIYASQVACKSLNLISEYPPDISVQPQSIKEKYTNIERVNVLQQYALAVMNYKFCNIGLLEMAVTHSSTRGDILKVEDRLKLLQSSANNDALDINILSKQIELSSKIFNQIDSSDISYDRLAFLGQAVYSQVLSTYILENFTNFFPNDLEELLECGESSLLKSVMASICKVDQLFKVGAAFNYLQSLVSKQAYSFRSQYGFNLNNKNNGTYNNSMKVDSFLFQQNDNSPPIQLLSNLFDSLIGSIFIDNNMDYTITKQWITKNIYLFSAPKILSEILEIYPKYRFKLYLNKQNIDISDIHIIKLPHPEAYKPANRGLFQFQVYNIKTDTFINHAPLNLSSINLVYSEIIK